MSKLENKKVLVLIVTAIIALGIIMSIFPGANLDTEYTGGTMVIINMGEKFNYQDVEKAFAGMDRSEVLVSKNNEAIVTLKSSDSAKVSSGINELKKTYKSAALVSSEKISSSSSPYSLAFVGLPVLALAILVFIYIRVLYGYKSALAGILSIILAMVLTVALSIIFRVRISPMLTSAVLITAVLAAAEAILFARVYSSMQKKKDNEDMIQKALQSMPVKIWSAIIVVAIIAVCIIILATPTLKMFALSLLLGVISTAFAVRFIIPVIMRNVKTK